ncbi:hypothetical protein FKG94_18470 [Exilibacterium tricleocarpae]|uniref:Uncharacterized protein n=1 Tax=Exilibacterium tricleocarpae TaxID=2591008 RepID=A0A545T632_9GAMM|nr:hypothetical protein [Exilibacterium tricleocarpae]TQV72674.1 hypothetical protein FKG94_18470 [Exilibacterium tricleocarpae]
MEPLSATFWVFGVILLAASWVLLLIESFKEDYAWGLSTLFLPPLSYLYALFVWEKTREAILLAVVGWVLVFLSLG